MVDIYSVLLFLFEEIHGSEGKLYKAILQSISK
jgi:hypothetical protein